MAPKRPSALQWTRISRAFFAATSVAVVMLVPLVAVLTSAIGGGHPSAPDPVVPASSGTHWVWWALGGVGFVVALGIAVFQTVEKYRRLTYDPTWALKYQEMFTALWDETEERPKAALLLLNHKNDLANIHDEAVRKRLAPIDEVLDLLEDIAFYTKGGQMSPETAHHHFYHWIKGYQDCARSYIDAWRIKDPMRWSTLAWLREVTDAVERGSARGAAPSTLSAEQCTEFLTDEIADYTPAGDEG